MLLKIIEDLYFQIIKTCATINPYLILSIVGVVCFLLIIILVLRLIYRRNKVLSYYTDVIRTVSRAVSEHTEIIALNSNDEIIYTTHPGDYTTKQEFTRKITDKVVSVNELRSFLRMLDAKKPYGTMMSGAGTGLQNQFKRWIATCTHVTEQESITGGDVSVITVTDVSKYFDEAEKIHKNNMQLEKFLDNFPLGIFYVNNRGIIVGANMTFANLVMVSREHVIGASIQDFIDDFNIEEQSQKSYEIVSLKPKYVPMFNAVLIKSSFSTSSSMQPWIIFKMEEIKPTQKECDNAFLEQEAFLFSSVPSIVISKAGEIMAINPSFATMIQDKVVLEKNKIMQPGNNVLDFVQDNANSILTRILQVFGSNEKQDPVEVKFRGSEIVTLAYMSRLQKYSSKNPDANNLLLIQFFDISEQKILEQQFIQSQKMQAVGQLAGGIAHDFNNLLTAMIGFCDLLLQRYTQNDPSYGDVIQIKQNAKRAANLVRQLLAFSRQQALKPRVVSVTDILIELASLLKRLIGADIEFELIHGRDIWPIKVDYSQFEQVIINLCVNARDAMDRNGKLTIKTRNFFADKPFKCIFDTVLPGDYVLIEVIDTGTGIDPNMLENIFEPFFSQKSSEIRMVSGSGTGLGLSTVYGIVNQTGGFIRVETALGKGSNFQIFIPRYMGNESIQNATKKQNPRDLSGSETILLVEDEDSVRMFSARALRDKGYKVLEADCGEEAIRIAHSEKFDLLITDVVMPKMDGPTLSNTLRKTFKDLKTIFISGYTEDTFRKDLDKNSNIHFLQKPFTLKDLANKVKEVTTSTK
ncbi:MAG: response regulator [Holosporales bacterium]|nr:response regulator [Holosporales bacterium]